MLFRSFAEIVRTHFAEIVRIYFVEIVCTDKIGNIPGLSELRQGQWKEVQHGGRSYLLTVDGNGAVRKLLRLKDSWGKTDGFYGEEGLRKIRGDWWSGFYIDMGNVSKEGSIEFKNGKKPVRLIRQLIKMVTDGSAIILVRKPLAMPVVPAVVPPLSSFRNSSSRPTMEARRTQ